MNQLTEVFRRFGYGCAAALGVLVTLAVLGAGDAQASAPKIVKDAQAPQQVAMLGEPVRDGELKESRGTGLDAAMPNASVQPSGGVAVILWDEPGGKPGGGNVSLSGNVTVNGTVIGK